MEFPPPTPKEQEFGVFTLVCNVCQTVERLDDHSIEADVVATNDGVLRYCKRCGNATVWRVGQSGALPAASPNTGASDGAPTQPLVPIAPPQRVSSPPTLAPAPGQLAFSGAPQPGGGGSAYSAASPSDLTVGGIPTQAAPASITSPFQPAKSNTPTPHGSSQSPATSVLTMPATPEKPHRNHRHLGTGVNKKRAFRVSIGASTRASK